MKAVRLTKLSDWWTLALLIVVVLNTKLGSAQTKKPNIIILMTDDVGWMDLGVYGGGADRGAPTPNLDRLANEGMRFTDYYAQPTCTLGRLAVMTAASRFVPAFSMYSYRATQTASARRKLPFHSI